MAASESKRAEPSAEVTLYWFERLKAGGIDGAIFLKTLGRVQSQTVACDESNLHYQTYMSKLSSWRRFPSGSLEREFAESVDRVLADIPGSPGAAARRRLGRTKETKKAKRTDPKADRPAVVSAADAFRWVDIGLEVLELTGAQISPGDYRALQGWALQKLETVGGIA